MIQRSQNFRFPLKAAHTIGGETELIGQDFDRNFAFEPRVSCQIHLTHSAFTEPCRDLMRTYACTDWDRH